MIRVVLVAPPAAGSPLAVAPRHPVDVKQSGTAFGWVET